MKFIVKLLVTSLAIIIASYLLDGVHIDDFLTAIILSALLALLNVTVKPVLIILTLPVTIFTLGLFLLVINAVTILIAESIIPGVSVDGFWSALIFSILISLITWILEGLTKDKDTRSSRG